MNAVAIVAIVAMLFAFLSLLWPPPQATGEAEIIIPISPPLIVYVTTPPLPIRNPKRHP